MKKNGGGCWIACDALVASRRYRPRRFRSARKFIEKETAARDTHNPGQYPVRADVRDINDLPALNSTPLLCAYQHVLHRYNAAFASRSRASSLRASRRKSTTNNPACVRSYTRRQILIFCTYILRIADLARLRAYIFIPYCCISYASTEKKIIPNAADSAPFEPRDLNGTLRYTVKSRSRSCAYFSSLLISVLLA